MASAPRRPRLERRSLRKKKKITEEETKITPAEPSEEEIKAEAENIARLIREEVSAEDADLLISDSVIKYILDVAVEVERSGQKGPKGVVNLGLISEKFDDGDVVDIKALKAKNLLDKKYARVKILSSGKIDKALTVKADDFSNDAVKMILLVGGTVVKVK